MQSIPSLLSDPALVAGLCLIGSSLILMLLMVTRWARRGPAASDPSTELSDLPPMIPGGPTVSPGFHDLRSRTDARVATPLPLTLPQPMLRAENAEDPAARLDMRLPTPAPFALAGREEAQAILRASGLEVRSSTSARLRTPGWGADEAGGRIPTGGFGPPPVTAHREPSRREPTWPGLSGTPSSNDVGALRESGPKSRPLGPISGVQQSPARVDDPPISELRAPEVADAEPQSTDRATPTWQELSMAGGTAAAMGGPPVTPMRVRAAPAFPMPNAGGVARTSSSGGPFAGARSSYGGYRPEVAAPSSRPSPTNLRPFAGRPEQPPVAASGDDLPDPSGWDDPVGGCAPDVPTAQRLEVAQAFAALDDEEPTVVGDLSELARLAESVEARDSSAGRRG